MQARIQPDFLIGKFHPPALVVALNEFPKDAPGDSLDEIYVIDKDAVVRVVVLYHRDFPGRRGPWWASGLLDLSTFRPLLKGHGGGHLAGGNAHDALIFRKKSAD